MFEAYGNEKAETAKDVEGRWNAKEKGSESREVSLKK